MRAYLFYTSGNATQDQAAALAGELAVAKVEATNLDADSVEGIRLAELYDVTAWPSALVVRDDGGEVARWIGKLPASAEISYYVYAQ